MMDDKKKMFIIGGGVAALIIILLMAFFIGSNLSANSEYKNRQNMIKLIKMDYDAEDYDRALDKLDNLLMKHINDDELLALKKEIQRAKAEKEKLSQQEEDERDQEAMQKLMEQVSDTIEKSDSSPTIIVRDNKQETTEEDGASKEELRKRNEINELINDGLEAFNNKNYAKAKSKFQEVLEKDRDNAEANAYLATTLYEEYKENGDEKTLDEAVNKAKKSLQQDNNIKEAHNTLAKIYDEKGLLDLAKEEYIETLKLDPQDYQALYALGRIYFKQKKYSDAATQFESAVKIKKDFVKAYYYLGRTNDLLNDYNKSVMYYQKATTLDPQFYQAYSAVAEVYRLKLKDYNKAIQNFKNAIDIDNNYTYHFRIGACYENLGQSDKAIESYLKAVSLNPQSSSRDKAEVLKSYLRISNLYMNTGKYNEAISFAGKGLAFQENNAELYYIKAFSKSKIFDNEGSIDDYMKVISIDKNYIAAYINLSSLYIEMNNYPEAANIANQGLAVSKNFKLYNNLGTSLQKQEKYSDAISAYQYAIALNSTNDEVYYNQGVCYKALEKHTEAVDVLRKAINNNKKNYDAYYELGESYFLMESLEEAKIVLESLLQLKPDYPRRDKVETMLSAING